MVEKTHYVGGCKNTQSEAKLKYVKSEAAIKYAICDDRKNCAIVSWLKKTHYVPPRSNTLYAIRLLPTYPHCAQKNAIRAAHIRFAIRHTTLKDVKRGAANP